jgi:glycerophosphoryl diester phosphodiesterase
LQDSYFAAAFAGERVATLEEAIAAAGEQIRLNVELKYNRPDPELAARVARVLRQENFLHRCVITSLDAAALQHLFPRNDKMLSGAEQNLRNCWSKTRKIVGAKFGFVRRGGFCLARHRTRAVNMAPLRRRIRLCGSAT